MVSWDPGNKKKIFFLEPRKKLGRFQMTTVTYRSTCCLLYGDSIQIVCVVVSQFIFSQNYSIHTDTTCYWSFIIYLELQKNKKKYIS